MVSLASPLNRAEFTVSDDGSAIVTFTGTISDPDAGAGLGEAGIYLVGTGLSGPDFLRDALPLTFGPFFIQVNLSSGTYYFRVKASDQSGAEGESPIVKILVLEQGQLSPAQIAAHVQGPGISVSNIDFIGSLRAVTRIAGGRLFGLEANEGILFSTGGVDYWRGPNRWGYVWGSLRARKVWRILEAAMYRHICLV